MTGTVGGDPTKEVRGFGDLAVSVDGKLAKVIIETADGKPHELDFSIEALQLLLNCAVVLGDFTHQSQGRPEALTSPVWEGRFVKPTSVGLGPNVDPQFKTLLVHFGTLSLGLEIPILWLRELLEQATAPTGMAPGSNRNN